MSEITTQALPIERVLSLVNDQLRRGGPYPEGVAEEGLKILQRMLIDLRARGIKDFHFDPSRSIAGQALELKMVAQELDLLLDQGDNPKKAEIKTFGGPKNDMQWSALERELEDYNREGLTKVDVRAVTSIQELQLAVAAGREAKQIKEDAEKKAQALQAEKAKNLSASHKKEGNDVLQTLKPVIMLGALFVAAETLKNVLAKGKVEPAPEPAKAEAIEGGIKKAFLFASVNAGLERAMSAFRKISKLNRAPAPAPRAPEDDDEPKPIHHTQEEKLGKSRRRRHASLKAVPLAEPQPAPEVLQKAAHDGIEAPRPTTSWFAKKLRRHNLRIAHRLMLEGDDDDE